MGIGGGVFYGNITGVCIKEVRRKTTLLNIKYDNGEEEEVTITQLMARQHLYRKEHQYNTEAIKKLLPARPPTPTTKKKNTTKKKAASKTTIKKK